MGFYNDSDQAFVKRGIVELNEIQRITCANDDQGWLQERNLKVNIIKWQLVERREVRL